MNDRFIIVTIDGCYVVLWCEWNDEYQSYEKPQPMKNFGEYQSDAKVFNTHNRKMDALVATKLKQESNIRYPLVEKLATLMGKFSGGVQMEDNFHVQTSEKILHKNLSRIDFNMTD